MITRAIKHVAALATMKLLGLAIIDDMQSDYIRFRAVSIHTIDEAMEICERIRKETGICVSVMV